jgi:hypothetical protein
MLVFGGKLHLLALPIRVTHISETKIAALYFFFSFFFFCHTFFSKREAKKCGKSNNRAELAMKTGFFVG